MSDSCKICKGHRVVFDRYALGGPGEEDCRHCNATGIEPNSLTDRTLKENAALRAKLGQQMQWVSVAERLPKEGELVLIFTTNKTIETRRLLISEKYKWWEFGTGCCGVDWGTHWMPIPNPPKGEC